LPFDEVADGSVGNDAMAAYLLDFVHRCQQGQVHALDVAGNILRQQLRQVVGSDGRAFLVVGATLLRR
jgi:hypothetical protein